MPPPRLIPVLDVMNGQVVRAVGGRRDEYKPVVSRLTASTDPIEVAKALVDATGARELYLADLDAIQGRGDNLSAVRRIVELIGVEVWTDFGYTTYEDAKKIPNEWVPGVNPVVGSETLSTPRELALAAIHFMPFIAFSLDLRDGSLVGDWTRWRDEGVNGPEDVVSLAAAADVPFLFLLDLARVGKGTGPGTELLCRSVKARCPQSELYAGGGVRTWADVEHLGEAGASGVLVASALHDGTLRAR